MSFHMNLNITCKTPICRVLHRILYKFRIQKKNIGYLHACWTTRDRPLSSKIWYGFHINSIFFQWSTCTIPCYTPDIPKSSGRNTRSRDCNHIKNKSKGQDQYCEGKDSIIISQILKHLRVRPYYKSNFGRSLITKCRGIWKIYSQNPSYLIEKILFIYDM